MIKRIRTRTGFRVIALCSALSVSCSVSALNILLTNDDGLTSNIRALYSSLKRDGHDVIVSVPCYGQSGMGGAIHFFKPLTALDVPCLNQAASRGDPGAGPFTKKRDDIDYHDFYYVNGTPIMATAYGLDILAIQRWDKQPDLVLSGPNEGRNAGPIIKSSGTVNNALFAASRGIPAMAVSAGLNTHTELDSEGRFTDKQTALTVAELTARFLRTIVSSLNGSLSRLSDTPININFPDAIDLSSRWLMAKVGTYREYELIFTDDLSEDPMASKLGQGASGMPGLTTRPNGTPPSEDQLDDEAFVSLDRVSVSPMQPSFGTASFDSDWLEVVTDKMNQVSP